MSHEGNISSRTPLASARHALRDLPPIYPGLWVDQSLCAKAETPIGLVLLDELPGVLVAFGEGATGHG